MLNLFVIMSVSHLMESSAYDAISVSVMSVRCNYWVLGGDICSLCDHLPPHLQCSPHQQHHHSQASSPLRLLQCHLGLRPGLEIITHRHGGIHQLAEVGLLSNF